MVTEIQYCFTFDDEFKYYIPLRVMTNKTMVQSHPQKDLRKEKKKLQVYFFIFFPKKTFINDLTGHRIFPIIRVLLKKNIL